MFIGQANLCIVSSVCVGVCVGGGGGGKMPANMSISHGSGIY